MILLVSNSRDFATDYIVAELRRRKALYYRLDLDLAANDEIVLDPVHQNLTISSNAGNLTVSADEISSVLFRAPTYLRESSVGRLQPPEALARHQWAAIARGLMVFDRAKWINHPQCTYLAENKPYQLLVASRLGFPVPETLISNAIPPPAWPFGHLTDRLAVKALDSFLLHEGTDDLFFFTQVVTRGDLAAESIRDMPVTLQQYLGNKTDIRVTVVGSKVFAAAIVNGGHGVEGDWRLLKERVVFKPHTLPVAVCKQCIELTKRLGLVFGAIDLILVDKAYWFLEINPTGEWAWLVDDVGFPIAEAIVHELNAAPL